MVHSKTTLVSTEGRLLTLSVKIFALEGATGLSMRRLAKEADVVPSVIYHYFPNKDLLLKKMFRKTSSNLGKLRNKLPITFTASDMLWQRIEFQIEHIEEVVAILKFYLHFRTLFPKIKTGFVPDKAYLHIQEVLDRGVKNGEFINLDVKAEAKVITHAINGFLLEYHPYKPTLSERHLLVTNIHTFILRSLKPRQ